MSKTKEKADELIERFMEVYPHRGMSRNAALICVDEIIEENKKQAVDYIDDFRLTYWLEVKQHLQSKSNKEA